MLFHMLHTRKPVKTNPSTNFKHHFQHWCNQKLNPLVQKSETRKMNKFSKETVFFFTFCSSFLLFVFIYIFLFFYIFSVGLYTTGLKITAGQRTMSGLIVGLTGQTLVLPVILTGHYWMLTLYNIFHIIVA